MDAWSVQQTIGLETYHCKNHAGFCFTGRVHNRLVRRSFVGVIHQQLVEEGAEGADMTFDDSILPMGLTNCHLNLYGFHSTKFFEFL